MLKKSGAPPHNPRTGAAIDGETTGTTTAHAAVTMTLEAHAGIDHGVDILAVHLEEKVDEETETDDLESAGSDLQALQTRITESADTAATDTMTTAIEIGMVTGHPEDIGAHDDDLALLNDHRAPRHWSDAVHFLHKTTHSRMR